MDSSTKYSVWSSNNEYPTKEATPNVLIHQIFLNTDFSDNHNFQNQKWIWISPLSTQIKVQLMVTIIFISVQ